MIKYLGSKRVLIPEIVRLVEATPGVRRVLDLFSGTARVGHALKGVGYDVVANDHNDYAATLATCYVEADATEVAGDARAVLRELEALPGRDGWFTETYCRRARYFRPENGARIEAMRDRIAELALPRVLESVVLTALMLAADRVDSTTGVQMAYLKSWAPRAFRPLELVLPPMHPGMGRALALDATEAAASVEADLVYLDPPYNQHSYLGNYHVWETLVRWDRPEVYGVACKRIDCRERKSDFNSKRRILDALASAVAATRAPHLIVSFSNEGYVDPDDLLELLRKHGTVSVEEFGHKRYVGAQIGIYNPSGERVGRPGHARNRELLFRVAR